MLRLPMTLRVAALTIRSVRSQNLVGAVCIVGSGDLLESVS